MKKTINTVEVESTNNEVRRFVVGEIYATRSAGDYDCIFQVEILARTAKTVTIKDINGEVRRRRLSIDESNNCECFMPYGTYSLAPEMLACRTYKELIEADKKFEAEVEVAEAKDEAEQAKALTLEQLEQETGFTHYREIGQEFLAGKVSSEELLEKFPRYEYLGFAYGLAHAFGITITGQSYEEILSEIKEFIKNKDFERLTPEEEYKKAQYEHYLADKEYDKASNEYFSIQSEVNLLRSEWLSLVTAIKGFTGKRLHGLKLLEREIREKYFEVRLKSLRALKARREQAQEVDRASARMKEAGKKFVEEPISKAI